MTTEQKLVEAIGIPIEIKQVSIGKHMINYAKAGSGPPLLLIHGANFGWGVWYPNIAEFAKHFTVYAIDLPGAGRSSRIDYRYINFEEDFVDTAYAWIQKLGLQNIAIMGHSIGGWVAARIAAQNPGNFKKIILCDSVGFSQPVGGEKFLGFFPLALALSATVFRTKKGLDQFFRSAFYHRDIPVLDEFISYFYETMQRSPGLLLMSRIIHYRKKLILEKDLSTLTIKTYIIWGEHDKILSAPPLHAHLMANAGHVPFIEQRDAFNTLVINFLTS